MLQAIQGGGMNEKSRASRESDALSASPQNAVNADQPGADQAADRRTGVINGSTITLSEAIHPPNREGAASAAHPAGAITDLLGQSRSELDLLLAESQRINERSWQVIDSILQQLQARAWSAVDTAIEGLGKEIRERVNYEISVMLENFEVEANARLAARTDEALSRARESHLRTERELTRVATETQNEITHISAATIEELQWRGQALLTDLHTQTEERVTGLSRRVQQTTEEIRQFDEARQIEAGHRNEKALQDFQLRLERLVEQATARAEQRMEEVTKSSLANVTREAREIVEREMSEYFIQGLRSKLDQLADSFKR